MFSKRRDHNIFFQSYLDPPIIYEDRYPVVPYLEYLVFRRKIFESSKPTFIIRYLDIGDIFY
jgi:hypothetical protein